MKIAIGWGMALALAATGVRATPPEVAAEQVLTETSNNANVGALQRLSQVFALPAAGQISHVMLPVDCDPGATLRIGIEPAGNGVPGGRAITYQDVPGHALDALQYGNVVSSMRMVELRQPVFAKPGLYAVTLDTRQSGDCALWRAPPGTPYAASALLCSAGAVPAASPPELIAEQLQVDATGNTGVGDAMRQEFARGFQVPRAGLLTHVLLPLNCLTLPAPKVHVTLQRQDAAGRPAGRVLASEDLPAYVMDSFPLQPDRPGLRMVQFARPLPLRPGAYAFTVSATGGVCQLWYGPAGNTYGAGTAWLSTLPGGQPGVPKDWNVPLGRDLTFQVFLQAQ